MIGSAFIIGVVVGLGLAVVMAWLILAAMLSNAQ